MPKRTKIICTIGPASNSKTTLRKLMQAGMNVARLNFSHGTYASHKKLINTIRKASKESGKVVALLQDLQGPRIRLGILPDEGFDIKKNDLVTFTTGKADKKKITVTYSRLHKEVKKDHRILIADGVFEFVVVKVKDRDIITKALTPAHLTSNKGMNFPDSTLTISSLSKKDVSDLEFGIQNRVDFVALSFVRTAKDVIRLKELITKFEKSNKIVMKMPPKVIVKIEKPEAVTNFDAILEVADGVMIARGDLGIELDPQEVPIIQKDIIKKCNIAAKPVIVATQMLESMIINPRPTRAEISDVANAIIDHTDAIMLSGESAMGKYPVKAVQYMADTAIGIEKSPFDNVANPSVLRQLYEDEAIASTAALLAAKPDVKALVVASLSGSTARLVSKFRPELQIVVTTDSERVQRQLALSWGVRPIYVPGVKSMDALAQKAIEYIKKERIAKKGDEVVIVKGKVGSRKAFPIEAKKQQLGSIELITL